VRPELSASRAAVRKAGLATKYLLGIAVVLMMALAVAYTYLSTRQQALQDSIREDALWAVYQLDRETRALSGSIVRAVAEPAIAPEAVRDLALRYDILYSRLSILDNAKYQNFFENSTTFHASRGDIRSLVLGMEPVFNALSTADTVDRPGLVRAGGDLERLLKVTEKLLTYTNAAVSAMRTDAREEVMRLQQATASVVLALGIIIALLILNLMRQVRIVKAATAELEATANELNDAYKAAEAGNLAKSRFMATMGHEVRTPLNAILGMAELLSFADLREGEMENVRIIMNSGTALLEIINEILDFAKLEHGDQPSERVDFSPAELVRKAMSVVEGRAREQDDDLVMDVAEDISLKSYVGDPTRIGRVLINLLSNAVKFTSAGTVTVRAMQVSSPSGSRLRFEVTDTGIGIAEDALPRLFNAFSQVDGTISRRFGGTGLGLAICRRIVEGLDGEIGVDSREGIGSTFWFEVPAPQATSSPAAPAMKPQAATVPALRLLLVEDNLVNRQVVMRFLERLGQSVDVATDGAQAVSMATHNQYDLILMDMQMPVMDGIAATRAIRALGGDNGAVPIVAMTANASDSDRTLCREAGMDGFEAKPISSTRLASMLAGFGVRTERAVLPTTTQAAAPVPAASTDHTKDWNEERVAELVDAVGEDGFRGLLDMFFVDASTLLTDLHRSLASHDLELFDRSLHSLKGSAANLGYYRFAAMVDGLRAERLDPAAAAAIDAEIERLGAQRALAA
jgi:signal transduction histidine kinase/HPt (histidine-containing phosphotransfer) domain-containing protein/ActR/RegA family two-component response regulator